MSFDLLHRRRLASMLDDRGDSSALTLPADRSEDSLRAGARIQRVGLGMGNVERMEEREGEGRRRRGG